MRWTAEQIREWFERGRAEEQQAAQLIRKQWREQIVSFWQSVDMDELHARHIDV